MKYFKYILLLVILFTLFAFIRQSDSWKRLMLKIDIESHEMIIGRYKDKIETRAEWILDWKKENEEYMAVIEKRERDGLKPDSALIEEVKLNMASIKYNEHDTTIYHGLIMYNYSMMQVLVDSLARMDSISSYLSKDDF